MSRDHKVARKAIQSLQNGLFSLVRAGVVQVGELREAGRSIDDLGHIQTMPDSGGMVRMHDVQVFIKANDEKRA